MLSPAELREKLLRKYRSVQVAWIASASGFPMRFTVGKPPQSRVELQAANAALVADSKRYGYVVERERRRSKSLGVQEFPVVVVIDSLDIFLRVLDKRAEFADFQQDVDFIRAAIPALSEWLTRHPDDVVENHGNWPHLVEVCTYFLANPHPDLFIRELPISPHTKFIEQNRRIVRSLLDTLLGSVLDPAEGEFHARFGLRVDEPLLRLRSLDNQFERRYGLALTDISVPVSQLNAIDLRTETAIVVENKAPFLSLPPLTGTFALFGSGFDVGSLKGVRWLSECRLLYWGDLDGQGFEILAMLRQNIPNAQSVLMDARTFDAFQRFVVPGTPTLPVPDLALTPDEQLLYNWLVENNFRLEQEKLTAEYVLAMLREALATV